MKVRTHLWKGFGLVMALLLAFGFVVAPAAGASVAPTYVAGNPSCTGLGYDFGFKVDPPAAGTYNIDAHNTVTVTTDGIYFSWTSTLGMDAVIAKGGPNANIYVYDPPAESFGDTDLVSPINPSNNQPYGLSHIEFCYDYEVDVEKTAETSFTRTFLWDIDKEFDADYAMFIGDSVEHEYEITVTKTGYTDSDWAVSGDITIENNTPYAATITGVADNLSGIGAVAVSCGVSFPYELASGGTLNCTYEKALPDGSNRTNTATVTTSGKVGGGSDDAAVTFGAPTTLVNDKVNVDDTNGSSWEFTGTGSVSYTATFSCGEDQGEHVNTATIVETGKSDTATVTVECYALDVSKTADTSFTREWDWTIDKSADQSSLLLSDGQLFQVNYEVTVGASSTDVDHAVAGVITVHNPAPIDATLTGVSDMVSGGFAGTVDCGVEFPYVLGAGQSLECDYSADLPDAASRINTATATLQNTPEGTTDFSGTKAVTFGATPTSETDECIDVTDTNVGVLGTVCASDAPATFNYSLWFGKNANADVVLECGENTHVNTAAFETNDTETTGSDEWTVTADVSCLAGCTLTQGYWKTHSDRGPAPYDDAWKNVGLLEEDTLFYLSGQTWYQVFWTPPAGNAYYNLAHQYMAAKLNVLNGASTTPAVDAALSSAETFFTFNFPGAKLSKTVRANVLSWASTLDQYNNGLIGPGHCSE